jgi:hypothetical protein
MWTKSNNLAVWNEPGRTEIFDRDALIRNIKQCEDRLDSEELDWLNRRGLELSIEFLNDGLKLF